MERGAFPTGAPRFLLALSWNGKRFTHNCLFINQKQGGNIEPDGAG